MVEIVTVRRALGLSPQRGELVKRLYEQEVLTTKEVMEFTQSYRTLMHYLRSTLKPYGIEVKSQQRLGYWLDKDSKEKVRMLLENTLPGQGETTDHPPDQPPTASENPVAGG